MIQWSWRVEQARSIQFGSWSSNRIMDLRIPLLQKRRLEEISLFGRLPELSVRLSRGLWLSSFMTTDGQPDWTVFLRGDTWLTVRRGGVVHERGDKSKSKRSA